MPYNIQQRLGSRQAKRQARVKSKQAPVVEVAKEAWLGFFTWLEPGSSESSVASIACTHH